MSHDVDRAIAMTVENAGTIETAGHRVAGATEIVPLPTSGRTFRARRRVGLADVTPTSRCRLDAITAYQQDIATADYEDAEIGDAFAFVLRRNLLEITCWPKLGEHLDLVTFCGGTGSRWAERRTRIVGDHGALIEAAAVWVAISREGRPIALPGKFVDVFGPSAAGRHITAKLSLPNPQPDHDLKREVEATRQTTHTMRWPIRRSDLDTLNHVNNTAHWKAVEEVLDEQRFGTGRVVAEMEYHAGLERSADVQLRSTESDKSLSVWLCDGLVVRSAARIRRS
jgi:acyl-ACP thioesterase